MLQAFRGIFPQLNGLSRPQLFYARAHQEHVSSSGKKGTADMDRGSRINRRLARFVCLLPLVGIVSACSSSNPLQPSVAAPRPLQAAHSAQIAYANPPVTLVVTNATST